MLMHGRMQNSRGDDSDMCGFYQITQPDLLWYLHCGWNPLCSVDPLMAPEINLWHDLLASMLQIDVTGGV